MNNRKLDFYRIYWIIREMVKLNLTPRMLALSQMLTEELEKVNDSTVKFTQATPEDIKEHVEGEIAQERNRIND